MAVAAACSALLGCVAAGSDMSEPPTQNPPTGNPPAGDSPAYQTFATRAWPALETCRSCHAGSSTLGFSMPDTPREAYSAILDYQPPLVDLTDPASSRILNVPGHTAQVLNASGGDAVLAWIQAEHDAHSHGGK